MTAPTGKSKPIENVRPGAWFQVDDEGVKKWVHVHAVLSGHLTATGQKITELRGMTADGELIAYHDLNNSPVTAITKREATKAGMTDPRLTPEEAK